MANYSAVGTRTASATLSILSLTGAASNPRRAKIYDFIFGSSATPGDFAFLLQAQRCTTAGTAGSAVTPQTLDPADTIASTMVGGQAHSADPTLTSNQIPISIALNQRATFRWVAAPGGEIVTPATASNGIAFRTTTAGALVTVDVTCHFAEQ